MQYKMHVLTMKITNCKLTSNFAHLPIMLIVVFINTYDSHKLSTSSRKQETARV